MKISEKKRERILEQILVILFQNNFRPLFTSQIAEEVIRDEEYVKNLLFELKSKKLVKEIKKNSKGIYYLRRSRWVLSDKAYEIYKKNQ